MFIVLFGLQDYTCMRISAGPHNQQFPHKALLAHYNTKNFNRLVCLLPSSFELKLEIYPCRPRVQTFINSEKES